MSNIRSGESSVKKLIKNGKLINDSWRYKNTIDNETPSIITLKQWQQERDNLLLNKNRGLGIVLPGETDLFNSELVKYLSSIDLVAIKFTTFTDGRGFSLAAQFRQCGFLGELRAIGSILLDQLDYLQRCGFDAFEIDANEDIDLALNTLSSTKGSEPSYNNEEKL